MTTVTVKSLAHLQRALVHLAHDLERATLTAAWKAAEWGQGRAVSATSKAGISASNTYRLAWLSRKTKDGAFVANSAEHAAFVELGRKPGRQPPRDAILEWLSQKRIKAKAKLVLPTGDVSRGRQARRIRKLRKTSRAAAQRQAQLGLAIGIARKIGRRGTKGRYILRDLYPKIGAHWFRQIKLEFKRVTLSPPRG